MIKAKVKLDYPKPKKEVPGEEKMTPQEYTTSYIAYAVTKKYEAGLDSQFRRIWRRIENKLEKACDDDAEFVEFENAEVDFIKRAVAETKYPVNVTKYIGVFEDEIENWK